jgi:hypothetical protein
MMDTQLASSSSRPISITQFGISLEFHFQICKLHQHQRNLKLHARQEALFRFDWKEVRASQFDLSLQPNERTKEFSRSSGDSLMLLDVQFVFEKFMERCAKVNDLPGSFI